MKNRNLNYQIAALIFTLLATLSCSERNLDNLALASKYPSTPEVFIDGFSAGLGYVVWGNTEDCFKIENTQVYSGTASMKFTVQPYGHPKGSWTQSILQVPSGRDLTGYNVLSFYAKSEKTDTLDAVGFGVSQANGVDYNTFQTYAQKLPLNTTWTKYYILIPDASKLSCERGLFYFIARRSATKKEGFVFYVDEMKFENTGQIAHVTPSPIFNGKDEIKTDILGEFSIAPLSAVYNLPDGLNQTVYFAGSYLTLTSSNPTVASVETGKYNVLLEGSTLITAKLGNIDLTGSLLVNSIGKIHAPIPADLPANVISVFSDSYPNISVNSYEPFWTWIGGGMTTEYSIYTFDGNKGIRYSNSIDKYSQNRAFFAITFNSTVDISSMKYFHIDVFVPTTSANLTNIPQIKLEDNNATGIYTHSVALTPGSWVSLEIPILSFGLSSKSQLKDIVFDYFPSDIFVDNIYFHK